MKVISWKNKPIFTEMIIQLIRQKHFHMVKGFTNVFDDMEIYWVINLTMGGNRAVVWPPIIAIGSGYVSLLTTLNTRAQLFKASLA